MERTYFFSGQNIEAEDLNNISDTLCAQMQNRVIDFFTKGVVGNDSNYVVIDADNTVRINPFIAYGNDGNRIDVYQPIKRLALDLSHYPDEKRLTQQGTLADDEFGWEANVVYDIYVAYIEKPARPRAHNLSGEFYPTRIISGFEFYALRPGIDEVVNNQGLTHLVRLCRLTWTGEELKIRTEGFLEHSTIDAKKMYVTDSFVRPADYNPTVEGAQTNLQDHIFCIGSGTPSPTNPHGLTPKDIGFEDNSMEEHIEQMHCTGLYVPDRQSYTSGFFIAVNSNNIDETPDNLLFYNLTAKERLHYKGVWLENFDYRSGSALLEAVYIQFSYGIWPDYSIMPSGTYKFTIDPRTGKLVVGCDNANAVGKILRITKTSYDDAESSGSLVENLTVISMDELADREVFDLAEFYFSDIKETSYVKTDFATTLRKSNFITKKDLRVFGSTPVSELQTYKETFDDILNLPYTVKVKKLVMSDTNAVITGQALLPKSYIQGYTISYQTDTSVLITPGICRDDTGARDIELRANISKYVNIPWAPGGAANTVGGLQNMDAGMTPELQRPGGYGLHVFVIMTDEGEIDVAFDSDIRGGHLYHETAKTSNYIYKRRIGTIYISHHLDDTSATTQETMHPFSSVADGQGLWMFYRTKPIFEQKNVQTNGTTIYYQNNTFAYTWVPNGYTFKGKFAYEVPSGYIDLRRPVTPESIARVGGYGELDLYVNDRSIQTVDAFDFNENKLYCVGYYDSRSIL